MTRFTIGGDSAASSETFEDVRYIPRRDTPPRERTHTSPAAPTQNTRQQSSDQARKLPIVS